jgi:hypothetical protein
VDYRWDEDTDILTAQVEDATRGRSLSVDVEGSDGSWLILDVSDERIRGLEVAVWPTVKKRADLRAPTEVESVTVKVGRDGETSGAGVSAVEVDTPVAAESDDDERTIHFRLGPGRQVRTVRIARDMLLDIDTRDRLAGVWLLDVPPFPMNP